MRLKAVFLAFGVMSALCSPARSQSIEDRTLSFGCTDVVVVGRVKNGEWHHVENPDDLLGHGWADATIKVRRVVRGTGLPKVIPVKYFSHTYMRDDRDFMIVLSRNDHGVYTMGYAQLMEVHPVLAAQCEPAG